MIYLGLIKSLELMKLSVITEKFQKIEEAAKLREEQNLNFSKQAEQKLLSKMESNKENRENMLNNLREKLKKTVNKIYFCACSNLFDGYKFENKIGQQNSSN